MIIPNLSPGVYWPPSMEGAKWQVRVYSVTETLSQSPQLFRFDFDDGGDFLMSEIRVGIPIEVAAGAVLTPQLGVRLVYPSAAGPMTEGFVPLSAWSLPGTLSAYVPGAIAMRQIPSKGFLEAYLEGFDGVRPADAVMVAIGRQGREVDGIT